MVDLILLFILPLVAGLSVWYSRIDPKHFTLVLSFSGAYILGLSFFHILPMSYRAVGINTGVFIILGFIIQVLLEILTKGLEHGHAHAIDSTKVPYALFVGLTIHSLLEGMPFGHAHEHGHGEDALLVGILIHKLPEAFILGTVLRSSGVSKGKAIAFIVAFACMSPLGGIISGLLEHRFANPDYYFGVVMALVVGIFLHIATTIIYEADRSHRFNLGKLLAILTGFVLAFASVNVV